MRSNDPFAQRTVSLHDQFEIERAKVLRPVSLCAPVEKKGVPIADSVTHLTCYAIQDLSRNVKPGGRLVVVRNQFGVETLTVVRPQTLCVPSTKMPPCSVYSVQTESELQIKGRRVGTLSQVLHIPYRGVKGSPCE